MNIFSKLKYLLILLYILCETFADTENEIKINLYGKGGKTHFRPTTRPTEAPQIELEPEPEPELKPIPIHEQQPDFSKPENTWHPIVITGKPENPITSRPPSGRPPRPEWNPNPPNQRPEPERPTKRTTPRPEPEVPKPIPESHPEPETPIRPGLTPMGCRTVKCREGYRCDCINPCPATCKNPNRSPCRAYDCKVGCVCDKGYVLNDNNTCIPLNECHKSPNNGKIVCDKKCGEGKKCSCENPCPATCANPDPTPCPTFQCNPGCYTVCRKGFVLDRINGDCIPLQYCPNRQCIAPVCTQHENEVFYECSTRFCNRTCDNPNPICSAQCIKPGNFDCKPNYVRDQRTGMCVLPQLCYQAIRCERRDEVFYECDTTLCQRTCQRPNPICTELCRQPGNCDCRPGLVRDVKTCRCVDKNESSCLAQRIPEERRHL